MGKIQRPLTVLPEIDGRRSLEPVSPPPLDPDYVLAMLYGPPHGRRRREG